MELKDMIVVPNIAERLMILAKFEKNVRAQQECLVRVPSSVWPPHAQLLGIGTPVR